MALYLEDMREFTLPVFHTLTHFGLLRKELLVLCCKSFVLLFIRSDLVKTSIKFMQYMIYCSHSLKVIKLDFDISSILEEVDLSQWIGNVGEHLCMGSSFSNSH